MLNADYKQQAMLDLQRIDKEYTNVFQRTVTDIERLQKMRETAVKTIQNVEEYIIILANRPRDFDVRIGQIKCRYVKFLDERKRILEMENRHSDMQMSSGKLGVAGALGGVSVAALGPTAAVSIAMTFGTASTGTAIASLSGAAATNAALAWLGGGALAAGGAGMAGGQALVALAGPVGWVIGGAALLGSLMAVNMSNKEVAERTEQSIAAIKKEMERIKEIDVQVRSWGDRTIQSFNEISNALGRIKSNKKRDYNVFTDNEIKELISLFNTTEVLSKEIGRTITGDKR